MIHQPSMVEPELLGEQEAIEDLGPAPTALTQEQTEPDRRTHQAESYRAVW